MTNIIKEEDIPIIPGLGFPAFEDEIELELFKEYLKELYGDMEVWGPTDHPIRDYLIQESNKMIGPEKKYKICTICSDDRFVTSPSNMVFTATSDLEAAILAADWLNNNVKKDDKYGYLLDYFQLWDYHPYWWEGVPRIDKFLRMAFDEDDYFFWVKCIQ